MKMATIIFWTLLLLVVCPKSCWTSTVRRVGCMVETGSQLAALKLHLNGQLGLKSPDNNAGPLVKQLYDEQQRKQQKQQQNEQQKQQREQKQQQREQQKQQREQQKQQREQQKQQREQQKQQREQQRKTGPFQLAMEDGANMTVHVCVRACWIRRYALAALQDGKLCLCGISTAGLNPVHSWLCSETCSGNSKQRCGGPLAMSVFHTGYEQGIKLEAIDYFKGLLGCFPEDIWREWCAAAPDSITSLHRQRLAPGDEGGLGGGAEWEGRSGSGVPTGLLVSSRMSAALCIAFCASQPHTASVAVLKASDTCCCGHGVSGEQARRLALNKVDFGQHCTLPCADHASRPLCTGNVDGKPYISAYYTSAHWPLPLPSSGFWGQNDAWNGPVFPANDYLEVSNFKEQWRKSGEQQGEVLGDNMVPWDVSPATPVEDPANMEPWVQVMDDPDEAPEDHTWLRVTIAILLLCLLLFLAMLVIILIKRKKN